jgi:hypothetical protein
VAQKEKKLMNTSASAPDLKSIALVEDRRTQRESLKGSSVLSEQKKLAKELKV